MPRHTVKTCEPFRAWNRLEPRARTYDFDRVLKSAIHDPLWLLTRQWQFGEFKGEDTGSPIFAKVLVETTKINKYQALRGAVETYSGELPLETIVERQGYTPGYRDRIRIGQHFIKLLDLHGNQYNAGKAAGAPAYEGAAYKNVLLKAFALAAPEQIDASGESLLQSAQLRSNERLMNVLAVLAGKTPDGVLLLGYLRWQRAGFLALLLQDARHTVFVEAAIDDFLNWLSAQYPDLPALGGAWNAAQLEYQFKCALPEPDTKNTVLAANEYADGRLDWFAFDVETAAHTQGPLSSSNRAAKEACIAQRVISFLPSPASFGGMPGNRFWEFEDYQVDLGNINAETTDIAKIIVVEYATMYGNNWFLIPYPIETGTLSAVKGIVVTDVFGQKTFVEAAVQGESDDWYGWGMFNLTAWDAHKSQALAADTRILIPPALPKIQESEPLEAVLFLRDETANLVWAVEQKIDNLLGAGMDGQQAAAALTHYLEALLEQHDLSVAEDAVLKYTLRNTVPENWIPFLAVHLTGQQRAVQLQRASMPRPMNGENRPVRPRSQLLRYGFAYDPAREIAPYVNPSANEQQAPYFIHEEEVPRAGIVVKGTFQRARWYDGKIVQWYGYKKALGKGEGSSGLAFDRVRYV